MRLPIRARLTAWYALFVAVILIALGAFLVLALRSDLRSTIDREVRGSASAVAEGYRREGRTGFEEASAVALRRTGALAQVLDQRGRVLAFYGGDAAQDPILTRARIASALAGPGGLLQLNLGDSQQPFRVMTVPIASAYGRTLVVVGESLQGVDEAVRKILILMLIAGPVALAAAALLGWSVVRNALRPVDRMRRKVDEIGIDRLHERLSAPNPSDEIGQLAATLNGMLKRLQAGVTARRQLTADASHELRTPLAAMRAELDVSLRDDQRSEPERELLRSLREEVDRMTRTVNDLLTLARADEGELELFHDRVELHRAIEEAARPMQALAAAKHVALRVEGTDASAEGDDERIQQAVRNLIENAIEFTPPGGEVTVSSWRRDEEAGVTVADTGIGISSQDASRVFDRFYRADPSRSRQTGGSGLGLAICWEIATAHGGRIWVQSEEGKGSAFSLALPADGRPPEQARRRSRPRVARR